MNKLTAAILALTLTSSAAFAQTLPTLTRSLGNISNSGSGASGGGGTGREGTSGGGFSGTGGGSLSSGGGLLGNVGGGGNPPGMENGVPRGGLLIIPAIIVAVFAKSGSTTESTTNID